MQIQTLFMLKVFSDSKVCKSYSNSYSKKIQIHIKSKMFSACAPKMHLQTRLVPPAGTKDVACARILSGCQIIFSPGWWLQPVLKIIFSPGLWLAPGLKIHLYKSVVSSPGPLHEPGHRSTPRARRSTTPPGRRPSSPSTTTPSAAAVRR